MSGFEPEYTNRGNYKCPYCPKRKLTKTKQGMVNHIHREHEAEARQSEADAKIRQLESDKALLRRRLEEAQKPKPAPKEERYSAVVYCYVCQSVDSVRIVSGQPIGEGGCFRCGVKGNKPVRFVNVNKGIYENTEKS